MTQPQQPTKRVRINVSRTSKGLYSHESTIEYEGCLIALSQEGDTLKVGESSVWQDLALAESSALVAKLNSLYPVVEA